VASYTYNGRNQLHQTKVEDGNLFTATRAYDDAGRLTAVGTVSPSSPTLDSTAYQLSPDGRRTGIARNGQSETYGYDPARQIESASIPLSSGTRTNAYQYDAAANRSSTTRGGGLHPPSQTTYLVNSVNQYTSIDGFGPSHDANGNLLTGQVPGSAGLQPASFTWNIHNELVTATAANGDSAQYQYDALGRKVRSTTTISNIQSQISFLYNGWNVELEYENGAYARRMTWGLDLSQTLQGAGGVGGLIMTEELPSGGGAPIPHFPTYDGNGNITAWVNASGTVTARQRYDAFGNIIEQTGTPPSRYGYSTKPIELVTGFLYYGNRFYDPETGRWPSRDPIGERGGVNLYGFVRNRPIDRIDRLGLDVWVENTTSVYGYHRRVCVDEWEGPFETKPSDGETCCVDGKWYKKNGKYCISFGVNDSDEGGLGSSEDGGSSDNDSGSDGSSSSEDEQSSDPRPPSVFPPGFDGPVENGDGTIYEDSIDPATEELIRAATACCKVDMAIKDYFKGLVGQKSNYSLCGQNCRDFSRAAFDYANDNFNEECE